jgi:hypothetical protein
MCNPSSRVLEYNCLAFGFPLGLCKFHNTARQDRSRRGIKRKAHIVVETCAQNLDIIMMHVRFGSNSSRQGSWSMYGLFLDRGEVNFLSNLLVICRDHHRIVLAVLSVLY